jgi:hypothetical protein
MSRPSRPQAHSEAARIRSIENSNNLIGNRSRNLPACSIVPQPTTLPRAPSFYAAIFISFPILIATFKCLYIFLSICFFIYLFHSLRFIFLLILPYFKSVYSNPAIRCTILNLNIPSKSLRRRLKFAEWSELVSSVYLFSQSQQGSGVTKQKL